MSSSYVRTQIKSFIDTNAPSEDVIDLTSDFQELRQLVADSGIQPDAPWLGIQFIGHDEIPVSLPATNDQGLYRESGGVFFHVVAVASIGVGDRLLARGESLRNLLRGRRIGEITVETVAPMSFDEGATLKFEAGYVSGSFLMSYHYDLNL